MAYQTGSSTSAQPVALVDKYAYAGFTTMAPAFTYGSNSVKAFKLSLF